MSGVHEVTLQSADRSLICCSSTATPSFLSWNSKSTVASCLGGFVSKIHYNVVFPFDSKSVALELLESREDGNSGLECVHVRVQHLAG